MSHGKLIPLALSLLALASCDASPDATASGEGEELSSWVALDVTRFRGDGESESVAVPEQGPVDAVALRVSAEPEVCFQLSANEGPTSSSARTQASLSSNA